MNFKKAWNDFAAALLERRGAAWEGFVAGLRNWLRAIRALAWPVKVAIVAATVAAVLLYEAIAWDSIVAWSKTVAPPTTYQVVSEIVRNVGLLVAGVFGLWLAFARTKVAQQGHITDRFSKAVEQLGHDIVAVRIGGLYALKRIAEDSPERDHLAIMDVVANFIRYPPYGVQQRAAAAGQDEALRKFIDTGGGIVDPGEEPPPPERIDCPDVVAAIEIFRRKTARQKRVELKRRYAVSLVSANLRYLKLERVDFSEMDLEFADFTGANLRYANLTGANLFRVTLTLADLTGAILTGANLRLADLTSTELALASLVEAKLRYANLAGASFMLTGLSGADIRDARLDNTDLRGISGLTQEQVDSAQYRKGSPPRLPEGLTLPKQESPDA